MSNRTKRESSKIPPASNNPATGNPRNKNRKRKSKSNVLKSCLKKYYGNISFMHLFDVFKAFGKQRQSKTRS